MTESKPHRGGYRRPADAPKHGQANCRGCGLTWTGVGEAHCTAENCHSQFSSTSAFDMHIRTGDNCIPPKEVRHKTRGHQLLEPFQRDGRTVWRQYVDPDKPLPASWRAGR